MYASRLGMQFTQWAGYPAHTDCGPFVLHLTYYSGMDNEDDEERSGCLSTLDTHGCLPTSDLAVEATMTLATAVTTQCTLALGEGPDS